MRLKLLAWSAWATTALLCAANLTFFRGRVYSPRPTDEASRVAEVLFLLMPLVFVSVGALTATHRHGNPVGWVLCGGFTSNAAYAFAAGYATTGLVDYPGQLPGAEMAGWLTNWLWVPGAQAIGLVLLIFPDGRLPGSRWRWVAWGAMTVFLLIALAGAVMPGPLNTVPSASNPLGWAALDGPSSLIFALGGPLMVLTLAAGVVALIGRFRRSRGVEREQLKWFAYAAALAPLAAIDSFVPLLGSWGQLLMWVEFDAIAVAMGVAILRYRLYDIDLLINRTLVYGVLSAGVVGVYVGVVGYLGLLFRADDNLAISLVATGAVAVLFQPVRARLQRAVNQLLYGQRDEPYTALAQLGRRLEATLETESVLPTVAETVAHALRLPFAAIALRRGEQLNLAAQFGQPTNDVVRFPLVYQAQNIGELLLAPRAPGEAFSAADQRLLGDLIRHGGVAAHTVRLTAELRTSLLELRRSREQLVVAQEDERQRIQRDLHDGLGPLLASMRLRLEACLDMAKDGPAELARELERLDDLVGEATTDIRRLVHALRPPVLDQIGLVPALEQHAAQFGRETATAVLVHAPRQVCVPPATEVAVFRVAQEALLNVHKHARARRVDVHLEQREGALVLEVIDDGMGVPADALTAGRGAGLRGLRDRADLLGGTLEIARRESGGTRLVLRLPAESAMGVM